MFNRKLLNMTKKNNFCTYEVSWHVSALLPARMEVKAPAGLDEYDLIQYIRENCPADFTIDTDEFEYDDGFSEIEHCFEAEMITDIKTWFLASF